MKLRGLVVILATLLMVIPFGVDCSADKDSDQTLEGGSVIGSNDRTSEGRKFPITVPPASGLLSRIKELKDSRPPVQESKTEESPQVRMYRQLTEQGAYIAPAMPQLPVDSRQRPVDDMVRNSPQPSANSPSSGLEWGINLKTHRFGQYYRLNKFGNTTLGLGLGRGKHTIRPYYKVGPNYR